MNPEDAARMVLAAHSGTGGPPVDVISIVKSRGILLYEYPFHDLRLSGVFRWICDVPTITVNSRHRWTRRRFTIAHELHHALFDVPSPDAALMLRQGPLAARERAANRFAAALLMPRDVVSSMYRQGQSLDAICATLAVSKAAMIHRCDELHLEG